ncbi:MAG: RecQ family ATP-dependent DNA helicase [Candidatus Dadabacteria bacterium]|nr:RecQ family ATP-dependent DNA helicase [Candidatus Dadabacteria bacterium]MDE0477526.1 RecQ family ATP-dependent DNA helicase [Candidatus Dadabacteria bacterium]
MTKRPIRGRGAGGSSKLKTGDDAQKPHGKARTLKSSYLSLDLEVGKKNKWIHAFAAVRPDTGQTVFFRDGDLRARLKELDDLADGASFLLGHNLINFDLPYLAAAKPDLRLLKLPAVDTLWLSPLAFPRNPYHSLVKHYKDAGLKRGQRNNPELDARITLELFNDECEALRKAPQNLLAAWHWLATAQDKMSGFDMFFSDIRLSKRPSDATARAVILKRLGKNACKTQAADIIEDIPRHGWALAYALAWLSVSGGNSVMPPWVRHQFPEAGRLVRWLRDTVCNDSACSWCRERHDARKELTRWFGFPDFRPEPPVPDGRPMQQAIVEMVMAGDHVLGIMPTGAGKSLCYQVPALSRYDKTGALTVVISPLVALMADQVAGLAAKGIISCVTINGLLSMPERAEALDRVRLGDASMLIISPEQLRSRSLRRVLDQREIGAWVLDEAHCLSKWGHDFRPDYRYVGRFIRQRAGEEPIPPVLCLTATAKPDVMEEITLYFQEELGVDLTVFNGGADRPNLTFEVLPTNEPEKFSHIYQVIEDALSADLPGGVIVYCATRRQSEEVAEFLANKGLAADHFHAGLPPETKKNVQQSFIEGDLRVIAATNAFGMGIDKPDVRLVVHSDMPSSLENYLQEAGRAGRDQKPARCVMLYAKEDVERQFGMSARSRLTRREIHGILRALRRLDRKKRLGGEVIATAGEILIEDEDNEFIRDSATDDTRVRTAISWLEEAVLLSREENLINVFPSSLQVDSLKEALDRLEKKPVEDSYRRQLMSIVEAIMDADMDEGISTDQLMYVSGLSAEGVSAALYNLGHLGIASNDVILTAFVHSGVEHSSLKCFEETQNLETALIGYMREMEPDIKKGGKFTLLLRVAAQKLREQGLVNPLPQRLLSLLRSIAYDGRGEGDNTGSLDVQNHDGDTVRVTLRREWDVLEKTAEIRRAAADLLLGHLLACVPRGTRGTDLMVDTTLGKLLRTITSDLVLKSQIKDPVRLQNRALLWLHEQEVIRLNRGLTVFRTAMSIHLKDEKRGFANVDFKPLAEYYRGRVQQIHIMAEFAHRGLDSMSKAQRLVSDYFNLKQDDFLSRWLPDRQRELARETTPASWRAIVESLNSPAQQRIVADDREQTNVLVLAGPGSGKTRVLVHRIAYLLRVRRENPRSIMALAYNRHAAVDIRRRLKDLVGSDASGVTVLTCHALAMRLVGASFAETAKNPDDEFFRKMLRNAVALLHGEGAPPEQSDEQRERLLAGFRWILVDEYQDIGPDEYELISALAGRTLNEEEGKLTLFAVGDDDQNIYAFKGASVKFIRRFEADYKSRPAFLIENYRSTSHIISAANAVIEPARERMKVDNPIRVNRARSRDPGGGKWERLDPVARGRVQILPAGRDTVSQAQTVIAEFTRLQSLSSDWDWSECAVIARKWEDLDTVRSLCEVHGIPVQMGNEEPPSFWLLRETRVFVEWVRGQKSGIVNGGDLNGWLDMQTPGYWNDLLREAVEEYALETGGAETPVVHFIEWLAEWGRQVRRRQRGLLLLSAHRAKGLEFDHVVILDGDWNHTGSSNDVDEERRLYYVAMTRAKKTLVLAYLEKPNQLQDTLLGNASVILREPIELPDESAEFKNRFSRLGLRDVNLGFAGSKEARHSLHHSISALSPGDPLRTQVVNGRWELLDPSGTVVGQLAKKFAPPDGMRCDSATVFAIVAWSQDISDSQYRDRIRCDEWEVVVPELVFEPSGRVSS